MIHNLDVGMVRYTLSRPNAKLNTMVKATVTSQKLSKFLIIVVQV